MQRSLLSDIAILLGAVAISAASVRADEIDARLNVETTKGLKAVLSSFKDRGFKNLGVLKFEVQLGGAAGPVSMTVLLTPLRLTG